MSEEPRQRTRSGKPAAWVRESRALRAELVAEVGRERLRELHRRSGWRHLAIAARQILLLVAAATVAVRGEALWQWLPGSVLLGFLIFGFTVLLHEVVHGLVFRHRRPRAERILAWLYALPSGLAPSQYFRWHLDHHRNLGSDEHDPKRAHLTPRPGARWRKLLFLTPALVPIYFRAARAEMASYPATLRRRIAKERVLILGFQVALAVTLGLTLGTEALLRLWVVPYFLVFPLAFTWNRIGQHYDVVPGDVARSGTRVDGGFLSRFLFLESNFHLEHHYFPGVPMHRIAALNRALRPFFARREIPSRSYAGLAWDWFARNARPHSDWRRPASKGGG